MSSVKEPWVTLGQKRLNVAVHNNLNMTVLDSAIWVAYG